MAGTPARTGEGLEPELDWSAIAAGTTFAPIAFELSGDGVDAYLEATGEHHPLYAAQGGGFVPPLYPTIVRLVKRALGGRWPSGTIQLDHRVATFRPLRRGERLTLDARIRDAETRNGKAYFTTRSVLRDASGAAVGVQESTSMWAGAVAPPAGPSTGATPRPPGEPLRVPASRDAAFGPAGCRYTLPMLRAFGAVAGALDPIHVDPAFAQSTRFGTNIAQGRLVMTLLSRLMLERSGRDWLEGNELSVRFVRPVPVDAAVQAWGVPRPGAAQDCDVWCELPGATPVIVGSARAGPPCSPWARKPAGAGVPQEFPTN